MDKHNKYTPLWINADFQIMVRQTGSAVEFVIGYELKYKVTQLYLTETAWIC